MFTGSNSRIHSKLRTRPASTTRSCCDAEEFKHWNCGSCSVREPFSTKGLRKTLCHITGKEICVQCMDELSRVAKYSGTGTLFRTRFTRLSSNMQTAPVFVSVHTLTVHTDQSLFKQ